MNVHTPSKYLGQQNGVLSVIGSQSCVLTLYMQECGQCKREFDSSRTKHHCRACGGGFCEQCSSHSMPVPQRGWGNSPVRVCDSCCSSRKDRDYSHNSKHTSSEGESTTSGQTVHSTLSPSRECGNESVTARYMGEVVQSAVGVVVDAIKYPKDLIVESA